MPVFNITSPDGTQYKVEGPEGSTEAQALERVKKEHEAPRSGVGDFLKSVPRGLAEGLSGGVSELATLAEGPVIGLARFAARQAGVTDKRLTEPALQTVAEKASHAATSRLDVENGPPQGEAGRAGETVGRVAGNPMSWLGPGGALLKTATAGATALGQWAGGALTRGTPYEKYAEAGGGLIAGVGAAGTAGAVRSAVSPQSNVAADLARAMERDGTTQEQLQQALQQARTVRPNATLADVGGENVRGLVERVAQTPGAGRTTVVPALTERQQQQMGRIAHDLTDLTGTRQTANQAIEETIAARRATADPLYDQAMNFNARENPEIVAAWERVTATGWGRQVVNSGEFRNTLQTEYGIADARNAPLMQVIDSWKKEVDGLIGEATRGGNNNRARVLGGMRDQLIATVDQHNPAYATARNAWSGPSRYLDAIEDGRNVLSNTVSAEELTARIGAMSDAEREAYRIGAVSAIRGKMGADAARMPDLTKYLRSPEVRAKIGAIMPTPEAAQRFEQILNYEVGSSELTGRALGNSATARRLAERADADNIMGDLVMGALGHGPTLGLLRQALMALPNRVRDTVRSRSDAILADVLVNPQANVQPVLQAGAAQPQVGPAAIRSALSSPLATGGP